MKFPFSLKQKNRPIKKTDELSNFLLHASDKEKQRVFREAANRANKDQQELVERSKKLQAV